VSPTRKSSRARPLAVVFAMAIVPFATAVRATDDVTLVAGIGRPAVGFPDGWVHWNVETPTLGPAGYLAFAGAADVSVSATASNTRALWGGQGADIALLVAEDDPIAGLPPSVLFDGVTGAGIGASVVATRSGYVGYKAALKGAVVPGLTNFAIAAHVDGTNEVVLRAGDPAPGFPAGTTVSGVNLNFAFSDAGMLLAGFTGAFQPALWFWDLDVVSLVATEGTSLGDALPGCSLSLFGSTVANGINDAGATVLRASVTGSGCPLSAIVTWQDGTFRKIVAAGDPVPGMPGVTFDSFPPIPPRINSDGEVAFAALLRQQTPLVRANSVWVARDGSDPEIVTIAGEHLPGVPTEIIGGNLVAGAPIFNPIANEASGAMLVPATTQSVVMAGAPREAQPYGGLPVSGESQLAVLAGLGVAPPGFDPGWFFESFTGPSVGGDGIVAFAGVAADAVDVAGTRTGAIWRRASDGMLAVAAREGMTVEVAAPAGGGTETLEHITGLNTALVVEEGESAQNGLSAVMSDTGQIVFLGSTVSDDFPNDVFLTEAAPGAGGPGRQVPMAPLTLLLLGTLVAGIGARVAGRG